MIRFLLNREEVVLEESRADLTVLDYLRDYRQKCGTKEGCASGDCGACTVVVASVENDSLTYRSVNSCIVFVGALHGKQLITVEDLAGNGAVGGELHPVQQAFVEQHAAQCGFCTPGFIMSLFALYKNQPPAQPPALDKTASRRTVSRQDIETYLGGNLCRCTGYRPIIDAALQATRNVEADHFSHQAADCVKRLNAIRKKKPRAPRFHLPNSARQLAELLQQHPGARLLAGGTDLALEVTQQLKSLDDLIFLGGVAELGEIRSNTNHHEIGAAVPLAECGDLLCAEYPGIKELLHRFGSTQVRNQATVGGNIANASPIADLPPVLIALGADLVLQRGKHLRSIETENFFSGYKKTVLAEDEFIKSIVLPRAKPGGHLKAYKISKRMDDDISAVCAVFNITLKGNVVAAIRTGFGGMAAVPKRALHCEQALLGRPLDPHTLEKAKQALAQDFQPISDVRAGASYRMTVAQNLLHRLSIELCEPKIRVRVTSASDAPAPPPPDAVHSLAHDSARMHVTGDALYVDDRMRFGEQLFACAGGSAIAHGKVKQMDLSRVKKAPGVVDVITAEEVPGQLDIGPVFPGDPLMVADTIEYVGQPLFAVAAIDFVSARKAVALARIEYEEWTPLLDLAEAVEKSFYVRPPHRMQRGDAEAALESATHRITSEMRVGGQEHFYLEGQASTAIPDEDGGLTIHSSNQNPTETQKLVAQVVGLPMNKVTVVTRRMGGGFGGKETHAGPWACLAALFALRTGRVVECKLARRDDMVMTGKRHGFLNRFDVGFDDNGAITAVNYLLAGQCGNSPDLSDAIVDRAMFHCDNCYYLPNVTIDGLRCKTHTVSNTAFRGFGGPQGMIVMESVIDEIAFALGKDPLDIRKLNLYGDKQRNVTPYHQRVTTFTVPEIIAQLESEADYRRRREQIKAFNAANRVLKKGLALTPVKFGISFTVSHLNQAGALVHLYTDGSILVNHGGTEMGQGLMIKIVAIVARELGVNPARISVSATRTDKVPNTAPTAASSGTDINGMAARNAARTIKQRLIAHLSAQYKVAEEEVVFADDRVAVAGESLSIAAAAKSAWLGRVQLSATGFYKTPKIHYHRETASGRPFYYYANGAAVSEVIIDTLTGEYKLLRADILHDVGASINPAMDLGQIEGGYLQGVGWLTCEELKWDEKGRLLSDSPATYKIPAIADAPPVFNVRLLENSPNAEATIFHSKAVGEPPLMLGISAWCAIRDAIASLADYQSLPKLDAPATPEEILKAVNSLKAAR